MSREKINNALSEAHALSKLNYDELLVLLGERYQADSQIEIGAYKTEEEKIGEYRKIGRKWFEEFDIKLREKYNELDGRKLLEEAGADNIESVAKILAKLAITHGLAPPKLAIVATTIVAHMLMEPRKQRAVKRSEPERSPEPTTEHEPIRTPENVYAEGEKHEFEHSPSKEANYINIAFKDADNPETDPVTNEKHPRPIDIHEGLFSNNTYILEVGVKDFPDKRYRDPSSPEKPQRELDRPVSETIDLDVVLYTLNEKQIEIIGGQVAKLVWPSEGPSIKNATFRLKTGSNIYEKEVGRLDLFIYYRCNVLYTVRINVGIQSNEIEWSHGQTPITWWETDKEKALLNRTQIPGFTYLKEMEERGLNIAIQQAPDHDEYQFTVLIGRSVFPLRIRETKDTLTGYLVNMRRLIDALRKNEVYSNGGYNKSGDYIGNIIGDDIKFRSGDPMAKKYANDVFEDFRRKMAINGYDFYSALFKDAPGQIIKDRIKENLQNGDTIQIWIDSKASEFIFPWAWIYEEEIFYDPTKAYEIHNDKFWGYNYIIEQIPKFDDAEKLYPKIDIEYKILNLCFGYHNFETTTKKQRDYLDTCVRNSNGLFNVLKSNSDEELQGWLEDEENLIDIIYFFSHGHTAHPKNQPVIYDMKAIFEKWVDEEYKGKPPEEYKELITGPALDQTHIRFNKKYIYLRELDKIHLSSREPIVFLNMCKSAQIYPTMTEGLIDKFIRKGARGVIGTEIPMIDSYADLFARDFFQLLFFGDQKSVGEALLSLRRKYFDLGNPLGFAYTYFGNVQTKLSRPLPQEQEGHRVIYP